MRAARLHRVGSTLVLEDVPTPEPPPGFVLVAVEAAGVCGTELHFLDGLLTPARVPITLGHEVAGRIAALGAGVTGVAVGDRVAVHYFHSCRQCASCRRGLGHLCTQPLGFLAFATDGGFAEHVVVPASSLVGLPVGVGTAEAAPLCCGTATALHALRVAGTALGTRALVHGCGGVGLQLVQLLAAAGVEPIAVARSEEKRALARALGATVTIDGRDDVAAAVREATGGAGVDAAFELAGTAGTMRGSLASLRPGGALVLVGYSADRLDLHPLELVVPELRILTSVGNTYDELVEAVALCAAGTVRSIVDRQAPLDDVNDVLAQLRAGHVAGRAVLPP